MPSTATQPSCRIIVKNLSKNSSADDLKKSVSGIVVTDSRIASTKDGVSRRFGFLGFRSVDDATKAIAAIDGTYIGTSKVIAEFAIPVGVVGPEEEVDDKKKKPTTPTGPRPSTALSADQEELLHDTGRIHVVNLPHSATREEIDEFFRTSFGPVREVHIVMDEDLGRPRGMSFVTFVFPKDAIAAAKSPPMSVVFQGRILRITPATEIEKSKSITDSTRMTDFQRKRLDKKIENAPTAVHTWNLLYMSANSAVSSIVNSTDGITRESILVGDSARDEAAVKTAIAETEVIGQTRDWLIAQGINASAFVRKGTSLMTAATESKERSNTTIIVKHLPPDVEGESLRFFFTRNGEVLVRFLLAPSKTVAIVQFADEGSAKRSFKANAFRKYKHVPLYLEWAPMCIFAATEDVEEKPAEEVVEKPTRAAQLPESELNTTSSRLCVRNVAFEATAKDIRKLFSAYARVVAVRLPVKMSAAGDSTSGQRQQHRGFAFVEFASNAEMIKAFESLHNTHLYGRKLVLEVAAMEDGSVDAARKKAQLRDEVNQGQAQSESKRRRVEHAMEGGEENDFEDIFMMD
jgi:multiple RNA-binding domain-containing protein 1